jgi:hypothetical protein
MRLVFSIAFLFISSYLYLSDLVLRLYTFRFLTGGGAMTLANWLSKAAVEEQTSVLLLVLKVNLDIWLVYIVCVI